MVIIFSLRIKESKKSQMKFELKQQVGSALQTATRTS